jgi:alginate O-acetyltransferase complex protein AlgI
MLFISFEFIFYFMPLFLAGYFLLGRIGTQTAWFLIACSLFFYGWWEYKQVAILILSVVINYLVYLQIIAPDRADGGRRPLIAGLVFNLGVLAYFKYAAFMMSILYAAAGIIHSSKTDYLPLGISFFTFTQIMFLVDIYRQPRRDVSFRDYFAFVTFFPHLIAGPLLHHSRIIPQLKCEQTYCWSSSAFATGLTLFVIGFFKKVILADSLASHSDLVFAAAANGTQVPFFAAWSAALSYTFQLYFDFSAYCDMALGLSKMINIRMPINFFSPYKAASIREFWRRWHITLSFFLRNYLYIPLGGNRGSPRRRLINLMATMVLAGLWHGAGWTFVMWGALHGFYLAVNHVWRALGFGLARPLGWALTFTAVVIGWVVFRAETMSAALNVLSGMIGLHGISVPASWTTIVPSYLVGMFRFIDPGVVPTAAAAALIPSVRDVALVMGVSIVAFGLPNAAQFMWLFRPGLNINRAKRTIHRRAILLLWHPTISWSLAMSVLAAAAFIVAFNRQVEVKFLYFQF